MLNFISYIFYGIALADFLGMFFGYDLTGQSWTFIIWCDRQGINHWEKLGKLFTPTSKLFSKSELTNS